MLRSWTCLHYNDNNCPEGLQKKYKIIEFDLTPWNLSFSQYVIFWQGVWLLISLQVSLGSFKLWFEIPRYFNSFYYYMHKSRCYCKWFMNLSYSWPVIRNIFKHAKKLLEITIPKILSEMLQWLAKLAKDALASAQVCLQCIKLYSW